MGAAVIQEFEAVVAGLETKSEKNRALARAGYLRTDIADLLEVRYQHVRKVLRDAGMSEGLQRNTSQATPRPAPTKQAPTPISTLLSGGFRLVGEWRAVNESKLSLSETMTPEPGVYAFGVDGYVRYLGLSHMGLRTRMGHYQRGHVRHRTSARVKQLIAKALANGARVQILIATPPALEWNGFPVNTAAGLEAGLIRLLRPEWNMVGVARKTNELHNDRPIST